jgi:hypothetical protein
VVVYKDNPILHTKADSTHLEPIFRWINRRLFLPLFSPHFEQCWTESTHHWVLKGVLFLGGVWDVVGRWRGNHGCWGWERRREWKLRRWRDKMKKLDEALFLGEMLLRMRLPCMDPNPITIICFCFCVSILLFSFSQQNSQVAMLLLCYGVSFSVKKKKP